MSEATLASLERDEQIGRGELLAREAVPASLISMRDIWKTYVMGTEEVHALHGVAFDVQKGEYVAIIGP